MGSMMERAFDKLTLTDSVAHFNMNKFHRMTSFFIDHKTHISNVHRAHTQNTSPAARLAAKEHNRNREERQ